MSSVEQAEPLVVPRRSPDGTTNGTIALDETIFGVEANVHLMHQVVTSQLAAARAGTHSTRTRAEVRGGGAKPYRQKGTGRARQGSERSPQFTGGGIALGPKPRSYRQRTPKKMVRMALRSALSDRVREGRVIVVDTWRFDVPRTREALEALEALDVAGRVLVVLGPEDWSAGRSFANLVHVDVTSVSELNAHDVLRSDWVVFTEDTLPGSFTVTEVEAEPEAPDAENRDAETPDAEPSGAEPEAPPEQAAAENAGDDEDPLVDHPDGT